MCGFPEPIKLNIEKPARATFWWLEQAYISYHLHKVDVRTLTRLRPSRLAAYKASSASRIS